jgi:hypothetical protein
MKTTFEIAFITAVFVLTNAYAFAMTEPYVINIIMNRV